MSDLDLDKCRPEALARMLDASQIDRQTWQREEFPAILARQLAAPLEPDLGSLHEAAATARRLSAAAGRTIETFEDLFAAAHPPLELLERAKDFAKTHRRQTDGPLPAPVATVLYYASIAAALVRGGRRITQLDDAALRRGLRWCLAQPWTQQPIRSLLQEALERLQAGGGPGPASGQTTPPAPR